MRYRVGIYGGMGCGKSTVLRHLAEAGANVLDADKINAQLPQDAAYLEAVAAVCPEAVREGRLDKAALRRWVLASDENRLALNAIAHPRIAQIIERRAESGLWFVEISVYVPDFVRMDESWHVVCAPDEQLKRVLARGGWTEEEAKRMMAAQTQGGLAPADAVIVANDGTTADLLRQVDERYAALRRKYGA